MSFYISPRFLDKLSVHIAKNYLTLPNVKVPLILGVHGRKGEGKSFQCELAFERMGINVVHMSAGELESPDAGDPARLIRLRYREAAEMVKVNGKMAALMINDIDAGAGRVDQYTQYTVNTQLVNGTLMNIADNPTNVQLPGSYDDQPIQRIPIIVTGNDFATLYQPLVRDGRMDKFYWEPNRDDRIGIVAGIFQVDQIAHSDIENLVDTFSNQAIDFFGALRSRLYDEQIRQLIQSVGIERISQRIVNSKEAPPEFRKPDFSLPHLIEVGNEMVQEQKRVQESTLAQEYNKFLYNRRLGETDAKPETIHSPSDFFRTYQPNDPPSDNGHPHPSSSVQTFRQPDQPDNRHSHSPSSVQTFRQPDQPDNRHSHSPSSVQTFRRNVSSNSSAQGETNTASYAGQPSSTLLTSDMATEVNRILGQGYRLGIEFVDGRRFRTGSWNSYGSYEGDGSTALRALESCLIEHPKDYVRLVGIDPIARRRMIETIIQRA